MVKLDDVISKKEDVACGVGKVEEFGATTHRTSSFYKWQEFR